MTSALTRWSSPEVIGVSVAALVAAGLAAVAFRRRGTAAIIFGWMMTAVTVWCGLSAVHRVLSTVEARVFVAQFQYPGIVSVGPLWFLFCRAYARRAPTRPAQNLALWIMPALSVLAVFTNDAHHLIWTGVVPVSTEPADGVRYSYGAFFWLSASYSYVLIVGGTWQVIRSLRERPPQYTSQVVAMAAASMVPLAANALYLAKLTPDWTPIAFAGSGLLFAWSLFRDRLLDVMPVARGQLFDRLSDAVFVLDPQYRIVDLNASARRLAGATPDVGAHMGQALPWWSRLIAGDTRHADGPSTIRDGDRVYDAAVSPLSGAEGGLTGWLVVVRDITERLRSEDERRLLDRRLQEQQHAESLTMLAGGLAHDFNNLLAGIMGNADMLAIKLPPADGELRDMAHSITIGAERAADLVAKMLAYAGAGAGPATPVDMDALAREMIDLLRASVARRTQLTYEPAESLRPVLADATQIRQVLLNLIVNAAEAVEDTDDGRVAVRTGEDRMPARPDATISPQSPLAHGDYVFIDVADTGVGMSPETQARMFDPFFTTKASGRGLGLASVQGIVRQHRGAIGVRTIEGQGTTIRVWLPVTE